MTMKGTTSNLTLWLFAVILLTVFLFVAHLSSLRNENSNQTGNDAVDRLILQQHYRCEESVESQRLLNEFPTMSTLDRLLLSNRDIQEAFEPIWCVNEVLKVLEKHRADYDPTLFDLLKMNVLSMSIYNQKMYIYKPILDEAGFYLRNASTIKQQLAKHQKPNCDPDKHVRLAICTMQHSNGPHIQEFVSHYLLLGASKVYIYDNADPDTYEDKYFRRVIQPFVDAGLVEIQDWFFTEGDVFRAKEAFDHCFHAHKAEYDWLGIFDNDEYLVLHEPHTPCLNEFLTEYEAYGAVVVFWRLVGPQGAPIRDFSKLMFEQYFYDIDNERRYKSLLQTRYVQGIFDQHSGVMKPGYQMVDVLKSTAHGQTEMFTHVELRHFYGRDLVYYLYEKICSSTQVGVAPWFSLRLERFLKFMKSSSRIPPSRHAPLLRKFLFELDP
eukprot:TRINITY_DN9238_c0_g1_i1.p1 TRINITY_DN9238_c0_g1~~TRINITY_DN9238_c0_g1_i1.p1  ORF type:complete len:438 (-),score=83.13 TRINITY_DN9238_c0_g1_i1:48-1361(-)